MGKTDHGSDGFAPVSTDRLVRGQPLLHRETTEIVLASFYRVYNALGAGFVEAVYANALAIEMTSLGATVQREVRVSVYYEGHEVGRFRADQIINHVVLVETKAADSICAEHEQQVHNYLRATKLEVALLLNFGRKPAFQRILLTNNRKTTG